MTRILPDECQQSMYCSIPDRPRQETAPALPVRPSKFDPKSYAQPFCDFLSDNPTVFHAVAAFSAELKEAGFTKLSERENWKLRRGGKYFFDRNGSSLLAFTVGDAYESGNGVAMIGGHIDAITAKVKPVSTLPNKEGYVQLGVAPYAGALSKTWWDRDLGIAGKVLVKDRSGKIVTNLVDLHEPIARIPSLAEHFGTIASESNQETRMVPIIGLDNSDLGLAGSSNEEQRSGSSILGGGARTFASTQPPSLVKAVAAKLGIDNVDNIVNWELELYDVQGANLGGLNKEFIYGGRIDDKLCSWSALEALIESSKSTASSGIISLVGLFDDEEVGSLLRQGANGNLLPITIERIIGSLSDGSTSAANNLARTYANSFLVSADVTHAVNPNFLDAYLANHMPRLNVGVTISAGSNAHMTTDATSTAFMQQVAEKCDCTLQVFQIRNDAREGGTIGPMLSAHMGVRAVDVGEPQLSMHSMRATTGALDPGLGVKLFKGFFDHYEEVDAQFQ